MKQRWIPKNKQEIAELREKIASGWPVTQEQASEDFDNSVPTDIIELMKIIEKDKNNGKNE